MCERIVLDGKEFQITIQRLCQQLIENHNDFSNTVLIGIQTRGTFLANRIVAEISKLIPESQLLKGDLDITFFRDDFRKHSTPLIPNQTKINFLIEEKKVILIDDVLWTGRTVRAAMDALLAFGRPNKIELLVLVNRRCARDLPIGADYIGIQMDTTVSQQVAVQWQEVDGIDRIILCNN